MVEVFLILVSTLSQVDGSELELLQHLHDSVYQQAQDWYQRLGGRIREQINRQYGTMPDKEENIQVEKSLQILKLCSNTFVQQFAGQQIVMLSNSDMIMFPSST